MSPAPFPKRHLGKRHANDFADLARIEGAHARQSGIAAAGCPDRSRWSLKTASGPEGQPANGPVSEVREALAASKTDSEEEGSWGRAAGIVPGDEL